MITGRYRISPISPQTNEGPPDERQ
jgi:hypothetical protein